MSAPLRYARILNGLSFRISSRSAISPRTRAMPALSKAQAFRFDPELEQPRPAGRERGGDRGLRVGRPVREQAAASARAADFRGGGAGRPRADDEIVDHGRGDAG